MLSFICWCSHSYSLSVFLIWYHLTERSFPSCCFAWLCYDSEPLEEKLFGAVYKKVRLDSNSPDFTGNVHFMLNRDKYKSVMTYDLLENTKEEIDMALRH
jgi:hypothetical protein